MPLTIGFIYEEDHHVRLLYIQWSFIILLYKKEKERGREKEQRTFILLFLEILLHS